jgi:Holliday junction resolvase RusA-like endonuclease
MVNITIPLPPVTKKNHGRIVQRGGRPMLLPSEQFERYQEAAGWYLRPLGVSEPVNVRCLFYMPTRRIVDLVGLLQAIDDVMVHYGVIEDDNSRIVVSHDGSRVLYDKGNPRTEITITSVDGESI